MIPRKDAVALANTHFPNGPESIAANLEISVEMADLSGCDGWCIRLGAIAMIRVNSRSSTVRQRFTLAHELSHLILGTKPDVALRPFQSDSAEEREADALAAELLIPESTAREFLSDSLPVDARTLRRLAKAARVSPIMAACRIVNMADDLGLMNAAVVFFDDQKQYQWRFSNGLRFSNTDAQKLFEKAVSAAPGMVRVPNTDGKLVVGSVIRADRYTALFLQLLPPEIATHKTCDERLRELKEKLFQDDYSFQQSVAACIGIVRKHTDNTSVDEAVNAFFKKYITPSKKWTQTQRERLLSEEGREYLGLEMTKSFPQI